MIAVVQRVHRSSVEVDGEVVGAIGNGLLILLGVADDDADGDSAWLAKKCADLRIFPDADDKMNLAVLEAKGACLVVSQFTLLGDCVKGRRPSFGHAARPEAADRLYGVFVEELRGRGIPVETGVFQAKMNVELVNDGPVTLIIDSTRWNGREAGRVTQ